MNLGGPAGQGDTNVIVSFVMGYPLLPDLAERSRQPELMDDPQLDQRLHQQALKGLSRVNWATRTHRLLWHPIEAYCWESHLTSVSVLDLGCGSGDLLVWLKTKAHSKGIDLKITGYDLSPVALEAATSG